jgi:hypothetical protein
MEEVNQMLCTNCATPNRRGAFFCTGCGTALPRETTAEEKRSKIELSVEDVRTALSTRLELPFELPFAAGESPCKIKGGSYAGLMKQLATRFSGGIRNILPMIEDEHLAEFLSQRFLPGGFYDIFPLPILKAYIAALCGVDYRDFVIRGGEQLARLDLEGTYRAVLTALTPKDAIERIHRIGGTYYNWSSPPPEFPEKRCSVLQRKMPALLSDWYDMVGMSYLKVVFAQTERPIVEHVRLADEKLPKERGVAWVLHRRLIRWGPK